MGRFLFRFTFYAAQLFSFIVPTNYDYIPAPFSCNALEKHRIWSNQIESCSYKYGMYSSHTNELHNLPNVFLSVSFPIPMYNNSIYGVY